MIDFKEFLKDLEKQNTETYDRFRNNGVDPIISHSQAHSLSIMAGFQKLINVINEQEERINFLEKINLVYD